MRETVKFDFSPSTKEARYVSNNIQREQLQTFKLLKKTAFQEMMGNITSSHMYCSIKINNEPIAIVGICDYPMEEDTGFVWCFSTDQAKKYPIAFTKAIKELLKQYCFKWSVVVSFVDEKDTEYGWFNESLGFVYVGVYEAEDITQRFLRFDYITTKGLTNSWIGQSEETRNDK